MSEKKKTGPEVWKDHGERNKQFDGTEEYVELIFDKATSDTMSDVATGHTRGKIPSDTSEDPGEERPANKDPERMSIQDYELIQQQLVMIHQLARELDLDAFIDRISIAETIAPFTDPTLFIQASDNLAVIKNLALKLREFKRVDVTIAIDLKG